MKEDTNIRSFFAVIAFLIAFVAVCLVVEPIVRKAEEQRKINEHNRQMRIEEQERKEHKIAIRRELEEVELKRDFLIEMYGWNYHQIQKYTNLSDRIDALKKEIKGY